MRRVLNGAPRGSMIIIINFNNTVKSFSQYILTVNLAIIFY